MQIMSVLNYITWNVSPFIYEGEHFAIGWYGTLWTLGLIGMLITLLITFKHDGVPTQYALITFMVSLVSVIFFGHLFQGLFYEWYYTADEPLRLFGTDWHYRNYYFEHPLMFLTFNHGGFASHGCVLGVLITGGICSKLFKCDRWYPTDRAMMGLFWVAVAVRIGNLINNEICGIETTLPWGFCFGEETFPRHPSQIYEILSYLLAMGVAWWLFLKKEGGQYRGMLSGVIMTIVLLLRIMIEFVKMPQMAIEQKWVLLMGQWLSIPFAIYSVWLLFYSLEQGKQINLVPFTQIARTGKKKE